MRASTWAVWTSAPHRVMFAGGAAQFALAACLVAWEAGGRYLGLWAPPPWVVPPAWAHAFLMLFALFPWFVFGFAMTAVPNWTGVRVERPEWLRAGLPMAAGVLLLDAGLLTHRAVALAGGTLYIAGWLAGLAAVTRIVRSAQSRDVQAIAIAVLLAVGAVAAAMLLAAIALGSAAGFGIASASGVWLFLLPLFLVVSHRLVPFFSSRVLAQYAVYRPAASLPLLGGACGAHFLLEAGGLGGWTWLVDAPMAAWVGWLAWKWGIAQSFRARLLAMLHVALAVLAAALALSSVASLAMLAGAPGLFGRGPLHLLAVGYFAAMTVAMVSRVSLGHSGRALEADALTWYGFLALIATGALRALADFAPLAAFRAHLLGCAAAAFLVIAAGWAARLLPIYLAPRPDGRPG